MVQIFWEKSHMVAACFSTCFGEVCQDKQCQILVTFLSDLIYALSQFLCRQDFVQLSWWRSQYGFNPPLYYMKIMSLTQSLCRIKLQNLLDSCMLVSCI
jgi:hypothetical protein